jgi:hypothetical protein
MAENDKIINPSENHVFWYKSDREVYDVEGIHIQFVIEHSDIFNISQEKIESVYQAFDEPFGTEGKARIKILAHLFGEGWVRVRFNGSLRKWFLEVDNKSKREELIRRCINYFTNIQGSLKPGDEIVLLEEDNE